MEIWRVERVVPTKSGRWREVARGFEHDMRATFTATCAATHRGRVRLIRPPGELVDQRIVGLRPTEKPDTRSRASGL